MSNIDKAIHPNIADIREKVRANNILFGDVMNRIFSAGKYNKVQGQPTCTGNSSAAMLFDAQGAEYD